MNHQRIMTALRALLNRGSDDAFVIFEELASGKFVQFVGSSDEPLLLDLPSQALTPEEEARARVLFRELGSSDAVRFDGGSEPGGQQVSYQHEFGQDAEHAARFTSRVFREVYALPEDFDLSISEN